MHIADGALAGEVVAVGSLLAAGGVAVGLRRLDYDRLPRVAVMTSALFVASLVHVNVGVSSAHLTLGGLSGILLGWAVFPAVLVALFLQSILFQFGGLTVLGVNTLAMAMPGLVCYWLFGAVVRWRRSWAVPMGAAAGVLGVVLLCATTAAALLATSESFWANAIALLVAHVPVMAAEGAVTAALVGFLSRVRPELLQAPLIGGDGS